ncbi:MAG: hypothetical protein OEW16_10440 [Gammaproteobacteria bacterium]|nr:hypothetical protein [Gammaproteobacteria bacterium]
MHSVKFLGAFFLLAGLLGEALPIRAEELSQRTELLIFASGEVRGFDGGQPFVESDNLLLSADLLGTWTRGRWHALAEVLLTTDEQELERLQLGWEPVPDTFLWIGRFHQPGSIWNTRQHHGQYLQPSITRPAIENWEDEGGVLPQHVEGLLFESRRPLGARRGVALSAGVGISAQLKDGALEPMKLFNPRNNDRLPSYSMQIAFLPDLTEDDAVGLLASHNELAFDPLPRSDGYDHVDLEVLGCYLDIGRGRWQLTSTAYAVHAKVSGALAAAEDRFLAGYLQLQYQLDGGLTALARLEATGGTADSAYLVLFPGFVEGRSVLDLRWDFAPRQALSLELADTHAPRKDYRELRIQWSAALP